MAPFTRLPSGQRRVQVRRSGQSVSRSFRLKSEAQQWANDQESGIAKGETPLGSAPASRESLADLIDLLLADLHELRRSIGRSKEETLLRIRDSFGATRVSNVNREALVGFAKKRPKEGAGPVTIGIDTSFVGTVMEHAAAVHGMQVPLEQVRLARVAVNRLGLQTA